MRDRCLAALGAASKTGRQAPPLGSHDNLIPVVRHRAKLLAHVLGIIIISTSPGAKITNNTEGRTTDKARTADRTADSGIGRINMEISHPVQTRIRVSRENIRRYTRPRSWPNLRVALRNASPAKKWAISVGTALSVRKQGH